MPFGSLALALIGAQQMSTASRFELTAPLPTVPAVMLDTYATGVGVAQQFARSKGLQARILWIDATANLDRYNTDEKISALVKKIKETGFNTIVFDVKPISGHVVYPSKLAPKLTEWRGKTMDAAFDPLAGFVREAKASAITLFVSLNAFSEGHRMFLIGPGYAKPEQQTVLYESSPVLRINGQVMAVAAKTNTLQDGAVSIFTTPTSLPAATEDSFTVTVKKDGRVHDGFQYGGPDTPVPTIPTGGFALYGKGAAAEYLKEQVNPGSKLEIDSQEVYVPINQRPEQQYPLMMNPNDPAVQQYALDVVKEVVGTYDVQGVIYDDRLRYAGMNADFSDLTRRLFEQSLGKPVSWPDDVFRWTYNYDLTRGMRPGKYYDQWIAWRASTMQSYVEKVRHTVAATRPGTQFGAYVGSWYGEYPRIGHNYASPLAEAGFWFMTPNYRKTGTAPLLDFLITGAYYPTATVFDAMVKGREIGNTVESAGTLTNRLVRDTSWTYAGISLIDFKDNPDGLLDALQAACGATQGVMVFDLSHDIEPMWPVFAQAFAQPRTAPHDRREVLASVRARRALMDKQGVKDPPIIIAAGSSGTGH
ncbi:MAG: family 10 glycosylhydrolase [Fimbriimonas sp.]